MVPGAMTLDDRPCVESGIDPEYPHSNRFMAVNPVYIPMKPTKTISRDNTEEPQISISIKEHRPGKEKSLKGSYTLETRD